MNLKIDVYKLKIDAKPKKVVFRSFKKMKTLYLSNNYHDITKDCIQDHAESHKLGQNYEKRANFVVSEDEKKSISLNNTIVSKFLCESGIIIPCAQILTNRSGLFWIGFDAEWQNEGNSNKILSYQFWISEISGGLILLVDGHKLNFSEIISILYEFLKSKEFKKVKKIHLVSHFSRAEIFAMDFQNSFIDGKIKNIKMIQNSFSSINYDTISFYDRNRNKKEVLFRLFDSYLLSGHVPLKKLGDYVGIPKIENKEFIDRMSWLLENNFKTYITYSIIDSVISVQFVKKLLVILKDELGIEEPVITASQISSVLFEKRVKNAKSFLGYRDEYKNIHSKGKLIKRKTQELPEHVKRGKESYYGGRNETFIYGFRENAEAFDYDLKNAYPSAMLTLNDIDWNDYRSFNNVNRINYNDIGYAKVRFKFKDEILYPLFPIKTQYGLIFPSHGEAIITLPELYTAFHNNMLSECEIIEGIVFTKKNTETIPTFITELIKKRMQFAPGTIENLLYKLVANSFYGKTAQGINLKRSIDLPSSFKSGSVKREYMKEGAIYNPFIAGYITGFVRALVGEYLLYFQKKGISVANVTTDGFMICSRLEGTDLKHVGVLSKKLSEKRKRFLEDEKVLELKHEGIGILAIKTRGYFIKENFENSEEDKRLIAKGGIQTQKGMNKDDIIRYLFETYLNAVPNQTYNQRSLSNIGDYFDEGIEDLIEKRRDVNVNMDYDFKRMPQNPRNVKIIHEGKTYEKLGFETIPFTNVSDYLTYKNGYGKFKKI